MAQRVVIALLLGLAWLVCLAGVLSHGLYRQPVWEPDGIRRFVVFAAWYAGAAGLMVWKRPRWLVPVLGAMALLSAALEVGPLAPAALLYLAWGCYAAGARWFRQEPPLAFLFGLGCWILALMLTAAWPIHYRWLYWLLPLGPISIAARQGWLRRPALAEAPSRSETAALAAALFPLACHWLVALKPEASSDGLAMHAVIAARMAAAHAWPFDPGEFAWALMPMGGDWAWSIAWQLGGEACARLLNASLLALIAWMLCRRLKGWTGALMVAAFLATPLVQHVTGSLFIENVAAALILGALLMFGRRGAAWWLGGCLLCGLAMASKFGALAFALPLLVLAAVRAPWRRAAAGCALALTVASVPYVNAWARTGNPVFPYFNAFFRSPHYALENFRDARFETPLRWTTFYDLTFHSSRFIEGQDGSAGFLFFLLLPAAVAALLWRRTRLGAAALLVGVAGSVLTLEGQSNLRYTYAAMPLLTLGAGLTLAAPAARRRWLHLALAATAALAFVLNLSLLPAAGWYHKGFYETRDEYLKKSAPERRLVQWLNAHAAGARVAWLEGNAIGDFHGRAFTNSWHSDAFIRRLRAVGSADDLTRLMRGLRIEYVIAPAAESGRALTNVYAREFCDERTERVLAYGDMELRRISQKAPAAQTAVYAGPGRYDEITPYTRFRGAWTRDLQFAGAYRGTLVYTNDAGAEALLRFRGRAIRLLYTAAANRCAAAVSLDGGAGKLLDQHSAQTRWQSESPAFRAAQAGEHVLRLRMAAAQPAGCYVDLDGFTVE
jgi:membrane protein YdbS with pleckstrin-like domain